VVWKRELARAEQAASSGANGFISRRKHYF
jgi:hypothetical protein